MKNYYLFIFLFIGLLSNGQETFYKNYKVKNFIDFLNDDVYQYNYDSLTDSQKLKVKFLSKEDCIKYNDLTETERIKIDSKLRLVKEGILPTVNLSDCNGNSLVVNQLNVNNVELLKLIGVKQIVRAKTFESSTTNETTYKAGLLLKEDKLYVNIWPFKTKKVDENSSDQSENGVIKLVGNEEEVLKEDVDINEKRETHEVLFYQIPDDHTATFTFTEYTLTAITIPLKYRFQTTRDALDATDETNITETKVSSEEFSSSVNLAFFGGYSWGKTKFTHRKEIGNRIKTSKNTIGIFLGSSAVELKTINTNITLNQIKEDREGTIGTISFGLGYVKSWDKVSVGMFLGVDKGVGRISNSWVYDGKPWLGIGVGYDLFKI